MHRSVSRYRFGGYPRSRISDSTSDRAYRTETKIPKILRKYAVRRSCLLVVGLRHLEPNKQSMECDARFKKSAWTWITRRPDRNSYCQRGKLRGERASSDHIMVGFSQRYSTHKIGRQRCKENRATARVYYHTDRESRMEAKREELAVKAEFLNSSTVLL